MKPLTVADSETIILALQDEIRRSEESRYDHRLHGLLLVAHGRTCPEVAALLGDAPRTVEYWIRGFEERGLAALREGDRSEEHTSELQSPDHIVCRLLLEKKKHIDEVLDNHFHHYDCKNIHL